MQAYPEFQLNKSRFNLDTYLGRFCHNLDIIDPRTLFVSDKKLKESLELLEDYKRGNVELDSDTTRRLWEAQKIKQSMIHPDTGQKIFMPFRMSSYVPINSIIATGLLIRNPSVFKVVLWQFANQSHNACVNYANRNASKPISTEKILQGYSCAVTAAVSISVGLNVFLRRTTMFKPSMKQMLQRFAPLPAVVTGSVLNVVLMRINELEKGIDVFDYQEKIVGTSKLAAKKGLEEIAIVRAFLGLRLAVPSLIIALMDRVPGFNKKPRLNVIFNLCVCAASFFVSLPAALAIYPQIVEANMNELEMEIQEESFEKSLFFNKGL